jgi:4-hydroxy-tetrahydrodipicolinate synthase
MAMTRREVLAIISSLITTGIIANITNPNKTKRMLHNNKLPDGVLTAVLTPLDSQLNADYDHLLRHIKWLLKRGNDGIALLGTTGEANSFSVGERLQILEAVLDGGIPPGKLMVGTGCCAIPDSVTLTRHAHTHGVSGILLLPPFYYKKINDEGLETYMARLLDGVGENNVQIYLYHFPQLTGVPFTVGLIEKLVSKYPDNIIGMKDSGGDWSHMEEILKAIPGFRLYTGNEKFLLPVLKAGGPGCISANANFTSPEAAAVYQAWKKESGEKEQAGLSRLREVLDTYPSIGTLKYILAKWSGEKDWLHLRPPNTILSEEEGLLIEKKLKEINYLRTF